MSSSKTSNNDNNNNDNTNDTTISATKNSDDNFFHSSDSDYYQESSLTSCPPLFQLQMYGFCCPFILSEEDHDARIGVMNLYNYPILWYRKKKSTDVAHDVFKSASNVVDGIIRQFSGWGGSAAAANTTTSHKNDDDNGGMEQRSSSSRARRKGDKSSSFEQWFYVGIPSIMTIVDTDTHGPVIQIRCLDGWNEDSSSNHDVENTTKTTTTTTTTTTMAAVRDYMTKGTPWWNDDHLRNKSPDRVIPLYMVDKVASSSWNNFLLSFGGDQDGSTGGGGGRVRLYAAPPPTTNTTPNLLLGGGLFMDGGGSGGGFGHELLRFDTLGGDGETMNTDNSTTTTWRGMEEPNKYADKVIVQLRSLIDWNRKRMASDIQSGRVSVAPKGIGIGGGGGDSSGYVVGTRKSMM